MGPLLLARCGLPGRLLGRCLGELCRLGLRRRRIPLHATLLGRLGSVLGRLRGLLRWLRGLLGW